MNNIRDLEYGYDSSPDALEGGDLDSHKRIIGEGNKHDECDGDAEEKEPEEGIEKDTEKRFKKANEALWKIGETIRPKPAVELKEIGVEGVRLKFDST